MPTARHHGLIAALDRPRWHAQHRNADLIDQVTVLAEGLVGRHAWVDANKRTTWVALRTFLEVNGFSWLASPDVDDAVTQMIGRITRRVGASGFMTWLRTGLSEV